MVSSKDPQKRFVTRYKKRVYELCGVSQTAGSKALQSLIKGRDQVITYQGYMIFIAEELKHKLSK